MDEMGIEETADGFASLFANTQRSRKGKGRKNRKKKSLRPGPNYVEVGSEVMKLMRGLQDVVFVLHPMEDVDEWHQVFVYDRYAVEEYLAENNDPEFGQRFIETPSEEIEYPLYVMEPERGEGDG